jgi:hypothetical protein
MGSKELLPGAVFIGTNALCAPGMMSRRGTPPPDSCRMARTSAGPRRAGSGHQKLDGLATAVGRRQACCFERAGNGLDELAFCTLRAVQFGAITLSTSPFSSRPGRASKVAPRERRRMPLPRASFLWRRAWCQGNRNPLTIAQHGLADCQLKSAVSARQIQSLTVRIEVRAFDHEPIQIARQRRQKGESNLRPFDMKVTHRFKARLRPVLEIKGLVNCPRRTGPVTRLLHGFFPAINQVSIGGR